MNRKTLTGIAAAVLAAGIPLSTLTIAKADESVKTDTSTVETEKEFKGKNQFSGEKPQAGEEMPQFDGELPEMNGEMPFDNGQEKGMPGRKSDEEAMKEGNPTPELPPMDGEMPQFDDEMPEMNGEMPFDNGQEKGMPGRKAMGRKSDEEAMKEDNPTPELPEGIEEN